MGFTERTLRHSQHLIPSNGSFVVVGAHQFGSTGETHDQRWAVQLAATHQWAGALLVEASPPVATELAAHVRERSPFPRVPRDRVIVSNVGVCPRTRTTFKAGSALPFFSLTASGAGLPKWSDELSSFSRMTVWHGIDDLVTWSQEASERARKHRRPANETARVWTRAELRASIRKSSVPCRTLESELAAHALSPPAVLLIDAEGLDCDVVAATDWCALRPWLLAFEHKHCLLRRAAAHAALQAPCAGAAWNYTLVTFGYDTVAFAAPLVRPLVAPRRAGAAKPAATKPKRRTADTGVRT
jgi:hypothetical protein